jgi:hypothetical protein
MLPRSLSFDDMNASKCNSIRLLSWFGLAAPFIALGLCAVAFYHPWYDAGGNARNPSVVPIRHYGFMVSSVIGTFALLADIGFRRAWLFLMPLAGLVFTYLLYVWTTRWTFFIGA